MSAINYNSSKKSTRKNSLVIFGSIAIVSVLLFTYLMWYVGPEENVELVEVIAVTEEGCIGETFDGFAVNIGACQAQPGEYVNATVDAKVKERAAAMNPTR